MKLRTKTIGILAGMMAASLAGLIFLQYYLLRNAIELKEQAFRQNVNAAMSAMTQKLQTQETANHVFKHIASDPKGTQIMVRVESDAKRSKPTGERSLLKSLTALVTPDSLHHEARVRGDA